MNPEINNDIYIVAKNLAEIKVNKANEGDTRMIFGKPYTYTGGEWKQDGEGASITTDNAPDTLSDDMVEDLTPAIDEGLTDEKMRNQLEAEAGIDTSLMDEAEVEDAYIENFNEDVEPDPQDEDSDYEDAYLDEEEMMDEADDEDFDTNLLEYNNVDVDKYTDEQADEMLKTMLDSGIVTHQFADDPKNPTKEEIVKQYLWTHGEDDKDDKDSDESYLSGGVATDEEIEISGDATSALQGAGWSDEDLDMIMEDLGEIEDAFRQEFGYSPFKEGVKPEHKVPESEEPEFNPQDEDDYLDEADDEDFDRIFNDELKLEKYMYSDEDYDTSTNDVKKMANLVRKNLAGVHDALLNTGVTCTTDEHAHSYTIDQDGNGQTTGMVGTHGVKHVHRITNFKVASSQSHTHELFQTEDNIA